MFKWKVCFIFPRNAFCLSNIFLLSNAFSCGICVFHLLITMGMWREAEKALLESWNIWNDSFVFHARDVNVSKIREWNIKISTYLPTISFMWDGSGFLLPRFCIWYTFSTFYYEHNQLLFLFPVWTHQYQTFCWIIQVLSKKVNKRSWCASNFNISVLRLQILF